MEPKTSEQALKEDIIIEMVARAFSSLVNRDLSIPKILEQENPREARIKRNLEDSHTVAAQYLSHLVSAHMDEDFHDVLMNEIRRKYLDSLARFPDYIKLLDYLFTPQGIFNYIQQEKLNLLVRVQSLTGITIVDSLLEEMKTNMNIFLNAYPVKSNDIKEIQVLEKHLESLIPFVEVFKDGKYAKTEQYYKTELEARKKALNPRHPRVAHFLKYMGEMYSMIPEKSEDCRRCFEEAIEILTGQAGQELDLADVQEMLANFYNSHSQFNLALPLLESVRKVKKSKCGKKSLEVGSTYNHLAWTLQKQRQFEKARKYYEKALAIHQQQQVIEPLTQTLNELGTLFLAMGERDKAIELVKSACKILKEVRGETNSHMATLFENLGKFYASGKEFGQAEKYFRDALQIKQQTLGNTHISLVGIYDCMAQLYVEQKNYAEAEKIYTDALEVLENPIGGMTEAAAMAYYNLVSLYLDKGEKQKALDVLEAAKKKFEGTVGKDSPLFQNTVNLYDQLLLRSSNTKLRSNSYLPTKIDSRASFNFERLDPKWKGILEGAGVTNQDYKNTPLMFAILSKVQEIVKSPSPAAAVEVAPIQVNNIVSVPVGRGAVPVEDEEPPPTPSSTPDKNLLSKAAGSLRRGVRRITKRIAGIFSPSRPASRNASAAEIPEPQHRNVGLLKNTPANRSDRSLTAPPSLMQVYQERNPAAYSSFDYLDRTLGILDDNSKDKDNGKQVPPEDILSSLPNIEDLAPQELAKLQEVLIEAVMKLKVPQRRASGNWDRSVNNLASSSSSSSSSSKPANNGVSPHVEPVSVSDIRSNELRSSLVNSVNIDHIIA